MTRYVLLILAPIGQVKRFESSTPFMPIAKGDVLGFTLFHDAEGLNLPLRVVEVEHMLQQEAGSGHFVQTVTIITEPDSLN
jgi:hypothetical protein